MKKQTVYGLVDPRTDQVFYVGVSRNPLNRFYVHLKHRRSNGNQGVYRVIDELADLDMTPKLRLYGSSRFKAEQYWMIKLYSEGHPIVNVTGLFYNGKLAKTAQKLMQSVG